MQPTIVEFLTLNGAFDKSTLLIVLPNYIGMTFAVLTRYEVVYTTMQFVVWWDMFVLALVDIVSQGLCLVGLVYAGSSIFIIVYSSTTIWAAVWSFFLLKKKLICQQWVGILMVVFGLSVTAYDGKTSATGSSSNSDAMLGIVLILFGSFAHALTWVLIEKWTQQPRSPHFLPPQHHKHQHQHQSAPSPASYSIGDGGGGGDGAQITCLPPSSPTPAIASQVAAPELVCSLMGLGGCLFYSLWQLVYTLPRWNQLVLAPIAERGGDLRHICVAYALLSLMGFLHAVSFYHLLGQLGSVATGVMKGVQSVAVLVLSHEAFCSVESAQCFTVCKGVSLVVVLSGVFVYMAHTAKDKDEDYNTTPSDTIANRGVKLHSNQHQYELISDKDDISLLGIL